MVTEDQAIAIIRELSRDGNEFNSHDFIERYIAHYEQKYIEMLSAESKKAPKANRAFQNVNSAIGRFLRSNESQLGITGGLDDKVHDDNIHNRETPVQRWTIIGKS